MSISLDHPFTCPLIDSVKDELVAGLIFYMEDSVTQRELRDLLVPIELLRESAEGMRASAETQLTDLEDQKDIEIEALRLEIYNLEARLAELGDN